MILGRVLEKIAGKPMADAMQNYIIGPMGLRQTGSNAGTAAIPEPALHSFSSERREALQIPPAVPFYEETTFWNPSWTAAEGSVQTTDIYDMTTSMEIVGSGQLVSPGTHQAQVGQNLVGFGSKDPTGRCQVGPIFRNALGTLDVDGGRVQVQSCAAQLSTEDPPPLRQLVEERLL